MNTHSPVRNTRAMPVGLVHPRGVSLVEFPGPLHLVEVGVRNSHLFQDCAVGARHLHGAPIAQVGTTTCAMLSRVVW
jgi:hypothetical protein